MAVAVLAPGWRSDAMLDTTDLAIAKKLATYVRGKTGGFTNIQGDPSVEGQDFKSVLHDRVVVKSIVSSEL